MKRPAYLFLFLLVITACRKPYNPPAITGNGSYLVVAGIINIGSDSTTITLSRTVNVSSATTKNPVLQAQVAVVSDQGAVFPLTETTNGNYVCAGLNLDVTRQYRLSIKTATEQYQSDLAPATITPPIDSVGFNIVNDPVTGIQIYANSHDASNTVKYYRWDYIENWEFHAKFASDYITNGTTIVRRTPDQYITYCYTGEVSSDIVLGSSAKLKQDVIYQNPIVFIPSTSEKIEDKYSILLREYALTADAYNFYTSLKKNTEQLGSIFDAQPSQLPGNIHCLNNPSEPVIGYVSVCTVSSKRVFISNDQLPKWVPTYPYTCSLDSELYHAGMCGCINNVLQYLIPINGPLIPTTAIPDPRNPNPPPGTPPLGYMASSVECVDCTIRGSKIPPAFWK
ncbi:MAG TPA: DUF4249 domain-containing protein [Mucilaginibacter sp.]|jgi:hypothetical protein|nr:DUF4249 domain-containing protein [Mucilaginibacter sp.]